MRECSDAFEVRWDFSDWFIINFLKNEMCQRLLKIGQYLTKLRQKLCGVLFLTHAVLLLP